MTKKLDSKFTRLKLRTQTRIPRNNHDDTEGTNTSHKSLTKQEDNELNNDTINSIKKYA